MARDKEVDEYDRLSAKPFCKHCGGYIAERNPRGDCDHLYWPDLLTDEAKRANGYVKIEVTPTWVKFDQ